MEDRLLRRRVLDLERRVWRLLQLGLDGDKRGHRGEIELTCARSRALRRRLGNTLEKLWRRRIFGCDLDSELSYGKTKTRAAIEGLVAAGRVVRDADDRHQRLPGFTNGLLRSEEHTSEL